MSDAPPAFLPDPYGAPDVNPGAGNPYVNWCRACDWTGSVALWYGDERDGDDAPHCPRCKRGNVTRYFLNTGEVRP